MAPLTAEVELAGAAWGPWRGEWRGDRVLGHRGSVWELLESERPTGTWPDLESAVGELWPRRRTLDEQPWAIGWLGYEACADLGGDLPAHPCDEEFPAGWWLLEPDRVGPVGRPEPRPETMIEATGTWTVSLDDPSYRKAVVAIRELIAAGAVYQVNLTRRFSRADWRGGLDPLAQVLAAAGWPAYAARVRTASGELLCGSMELLLRRRGGAAETRPIKGTRPRGADPEEDHRLADELEHDAKERAELAMIVDLERNDLGRCAVPGSVAVPDPGAVHRYANVLHRVARVTAAVPADVPWWRLVAAMVPGGSVTGCPKRAAMAVIRTLEPTPRGPYTGALGVVAGNGDLELALPIRTAWLDRGALRLAAGGGIVWDSDPDREEAESRLKVAPWLRLGGSG